jgi:hypothetical protein
MEELNSSSLGSMDQGRSSIRKEYHMFYNFVRGGNDSLSSLRRETMFINILQGLHPLEAEIVCLVKDKRLQTKYKITKEVETYFNTRNDRQRMVDVARWLKYDETIPLSTPTTWGMTEPIAWMQRYGINAYDLAARKRLSNLEC